MKEDDGILAASYEWQNSFDPLIISAIMVSEDWSAEDEEVQVRVAEIIKRLIMNESQFTTNQMTGTEQGTGLTQITPDTLTTLIILEYIQPMGDGELFGYDLTDPEDNITAAVANLYYLYQGIRIENEIENWEMSTEDVLKLSVGLFNSGPGDRAVIGPGGEETGETIADFGLEYRRFLRDGVYNNRLGENCPGPDPDPTLWECIKAIYSADGQHTIGYVDNIFGELNSAPYEEK